MLFSAGSMLRGARHTGFAMTTHAVIVSETIIMSEANQSSGVEALD
jgi:hypothetical protein